MITWRKVLIGVLIIIADLLIYIILGLLLMRYDDFYDESEGEYWSLSSMTASELITYISLNIWHVINLAAITYIIYRVVKRNQVKQPMTIEKMN